MTGTGSSSPLPQFADHPYLIYDGECPFCQNYGVYVAATRALPGLELISARSDRPEVAEANAAGFDLDRMIVLNISGKWFTGEMAMAELAQRADKYRILNRMLAAIFSTPRVGGLAYRALVAGRLMTLRLLGRSRIRDNKS